MYLIDIGHRLMVVLFFNLFSSWVLKYTKLMRNWLEFLILFYQNGKIKIPKLTIIATLKIHKLGRGVKGFEPPCSGLAHLTRSGK